MDSDVPSRKNYVLDVLEAFASFGSREALIKREHRQSYAELRAEILRLAAALRQQGVGENSTVAVVAVLPREAPALHFALHLLGSRIVWIMLGMPMREIREYVRLTAPDLIVYDARETVQATREIFGSTPSVPILGLGPGELGADLLTLRPHQTQDPVDLAGAGPESVFQTSGTTGTPKAILHGEESFRQVVRLAEDWASGGHPPLRHLSVSPLWTSAGTVSTMITLCAGGLLVLREDWSPATFLETVEAHRINYTFVAPPMLYELLDDPALRTADVSSLYMLNVGAAPLSTERIRQAVKALGPVVRNSYGMSESSYIAAHAGIGTDPTHPERIQSCGLPWGDVRIEIRAEDGTVLGPGETGEVWVSSKLNFVEYLGQPELTAQTLVDGWLRTGDVGYRDEDGYLYLLSRSQDMIITGLGSRNVFAIPIENALMSHPGVREAAVIGVPDPILVEVVHAYVVAREGSQPTVTELKAQVAAELPQICVPRSIEFLDRLPLVGFGKVDKKALRARYAAAHSPVMVTGSDA